MTRILDVYLKEQKSGLLKQDENGRLSFTYADAYLTQTDAPATSVSMPLSEAPYLDKIVRPFFSGLLPDEHARQRLASALGISEQGNRMIFSCGEEFHQIGFAPCCLVSFLAHADVSFCQSQQVAGHMFYGGEIGG